MDELYSSIQFFDKTGLFANGKFLIDANISVLKRRIRDTDNDYQKIEYLIEIKYSDNRPKRLAWVKDLKKLDLWSFEINDSMLDAEGKKMLQFKLLHEATTAPTEELMQVSTGLRIIHDSPIYVMGESVIKCPDKKYAGIEYETIFYMQETLSKTVIQAQYEKYIHLLPDVSEILFFSALFGVIKPFLNHLGIDAGFTTVLIGPPAHFKTTLIRQYALWLEPREQQEIGFYFSKRNQQILTDINKFYGQNYLVDDFPHTTVISEKNRLRQRFDRIVRHLCTEGKCANVFITAETSADMGVLSGVDRTLQIRIHRMEEAVIKDLGIRHAELVDGVMANIAVVFVKALMNHFEEVLQEIRKYYDDYINGKGRYEKSVFRVYRYAMFVQMTEFLFSKYVAVDYGWKSKSLELEKALRKQILCQQRELQKIKNKEEIPDYIADFFNNLNTEKTVKPIHDSALYEGVGNECLIYNGRVYITTVALKTVLFNFYGRYIEPTLVIRQFHEAGILEEENGSKGYQKNYARKKHYVINIKLLVDYMIRNDYPISDDVKRRFGYSI